MFRGLGGTCVEIKVLRRVRAESSRRPARHRRDACSMAWRCRCLTARQRLVDFHTDFHVNQSHEELLHFFSRYFSLRHLLLQRLDLVGNDPILLLLGLGLSNSFDQVEEVLGEVRGHHRGHLCWMRRGFSALVFRAGVARSLRVPRSLYLPAERVDSARAAAGSLVWCRLRAH